MLYLKLGTVSSRKTANMLMTIHEYESTNKKILILKPDRDSRNVGVIASRAGLNERECHTFTNGLDLYKHMERLEKGTTVFIDEIQFCSEEECELIKAVSQRHNILCYGLLSDYTGKTFGAISNLLGECPSVEWIKSMCTFCDKSARMNLRMIDGEPIYSGDSILPEVQLGKDEYFKVCVECFHNAPTQRP